MSRRPASTRPRGKERVRHAAALSPRALLGFALADVTRLLRTVYDARLSGKGLSGASWRVLAYLYREDGLTQTKLADLLEVSRPAIGQMIDRLEASGFVERRADPADRRSWGVFLSPNPTRKSKNSCRRRAPSKLSASRRSVKRTWRRCRSLPIG